MSIGCVVRHGPHPALDFARKRGLIDSNPSKDAARPRSGRSKPVSPAVADVRAVLDRVRAMDAELADAVTLLASTGMRKAELLGLQWSAVDLERRGAPRLCDLRWRPRRQGRAQGDEEERLARCAVDRSGDRGAASSARAAGAARGCQPVGLRVPGSPDPSVPFRPDTL